MTAVEMIERFQARIQNDPDLYTIGAVMGPYVVMVHNKSEIVAVLDQLATVWAESRGATFKVEDTAA